MVLPSPDFDLSASGWAQAIEDISRQPGVVLVLGAPDHGKTTWLAAAARRLAGTGSLPIAIVDADVGQTSVGPPATVALSLLTEVPRENAFLHSLPYEMLSFVGSVSPVGHLLQLLVSTKRLVARGQRLRAKTVLVDTTGLVTPGIGFQLKLRKIELLEPTHLVALQREAELEPLLSVVSSREGLCIHRVGVSQFARYRNPGERSSYRASRFADYFSSAGTLSLSAAQVLILNSAAKGYRLQSGDSADVLDALALKAQGQPGLLIGLNTAADETVELGLLESVSEDGRKIVVRTPLRDASAIRILQLGSIRDVRTEC